MRDEGRAPDDYRQLPVENGPIVASTTSPGASASSLIPHPSSFLLLLDPPAPGAWNMAVDEALLEDAALERRCWLRFYRWQEPTLSLGYFQSYADRRQHPASSGCPAVRRTSGGGAILHDAEVTQGSGFHPPPPRMPEVREALHHLRAHRRNSVHGGKKRRTPRAL